MLFSVFLVIIIVTNFIFNSHFMMVEFWERTQPKGISPGDIDEQFNRLQNIWIDFQNLTKIKKSIINLISGKSINKYFLDVIPIIEQIDRKKYKEFLERMDNYLKKNEILSKENFYILFWNPNKNNNNYSIWKYDKADFNQWWTWECALVSSLEILKKTPFFETMIRCSLKRNDWNDWWLLSVPLCNKWWQFKEIKDDEIKYLKEPYFANWRGVISESSLWFNILESIFIKEYFQNMKLNFNELDYDTINKKIDWFFISWNVWDMHLKGGVLDYFVWKDILKSSKDQIYSENMSEDCLKYILELSKTWIIKLWCRTHIPNNYEYPEKPISSIPSTRWYRIDVYWEDDDFLYGKDEIWRLCCSPKWCNEWFIWLHQYSVEKYFTKNNETYIVIINPWFTEKKLIVSLKQFQKMVTDIDIVCFNINDMFVTDNQSEESV